MVWLGKSSTDQYVAMKQFPKNGKQFDQSAYVELQIQQIIKRHSDKQGKFAISLISVKNKKIFACCWIVWKTKKISGLFMKFVLVKQ